MDTDVQSRLEEMRADIAQYEVLVAKKNAVLRLKENPDYQAVLENGFFRHEALGYLAASTDPSLKEEERADALAIAQSGSHVRRYLNVTVQMGLNAEKSIRAIQEEMTQVMHGDAQ